MKRETRQEIKERQNRNGRKNGFRYICASCDFFFYTDTWNCMEWDDHQKKTNHESYYDIRLQQTDESEGY